MMLDSTHFYYLVEGGFPLKKGYLSLEYTNSQPNIVNAYNTFIIYYYPMVE